MRYRVLVTAVVVTAALGAASAGGAKVMPAAVGGGTLVIGSGTIEVTGIPVTVSVLAYRTSAGGVRGFYRIRWAGGSTTVAATCLRVDAGRALVGGIVVQTTIPSELGSSASLALDDRGRFGRPLRDRNTYGSGPTASTCPFSPAAIAGPWDTLVSGDYFIFGASTG